MIQSIRSLPGPSLALPVVATALLGVATVVGVVVGGAVANRIPLTVGNRCAESLSWTPPPDVRAVLPILDVPPGGFQALRVPLR